MAPSTTPTSVAHDTRPTSRAATAPKPRSRPATDDLHATAAEAARRLRRMLPGLRTFARVMTRDPRLQVVLHHGTPCTDGRTIFMRPPIELGERPRHGRNCGDRDERSVLVCDACRVVEDVEADLYHEVAHIAFGSFAAIDDHDRLDVLTRALHERGIGTDDESRINQIRRNIDAANPQSYIAAARIVSPFLPVIVNALEDARVNTEMYRSRPGIHKMFYAQNQQTFDHGIRRDDGTVVLWSDAPLNAQVVIGLFAKASGFDYTTWFHPRVVDTLDAPDVAKVTDAVRSARSVRTIYKLSLTALEVLRTHGFCRVRHEPEDPAGTDGDENDTTSPDQAAAGSGTEEASAAGSSTSEADPADETPTLADDVAADGAQRSDEHDSDEATEPTDDEDIGRDTAAAQPDPAAEPGDDEAAPFEDDEDTDDPTPACEEADDGEDLHDGLHVSHELPDSADDDQGDDDIEAGPAWPGEGYGDADEAEAALREFGHHTSDGGMAPPRSGSFADVDRELVDRAIELAVVQAEHFDQPSRNIWGVNEHRWGEPIFTAGGYALTSQVWRDDLTPGKSERWGFGIEVDPTILAAALARARIVFADNRKTRRQRNLKRGTINARALARRVPVDDPRIFARRNQPGARDHFVVIGLDISGSTAGGVVARIKAAGLHMAELLHRLGVTFAVYAHTGTPTNLDAGGAYNTDTWSLDVVVIKDPRERWTDATRERLRRVCPLMCNLDGHTLEYYRKVCERQQATDKLVMYFTDGAMPAENYREELEILQREIRDAPGRGITIVGVGVGTDSPNAHGLDTVRLDHLDDIPRLVRELERRITT